MMRSIDDYDYISAENKAKLKNLESLINKIPFVTEVEWDLNYFDELKQVVILVFNDVPFHDKNYFAERADIKAKTIELARKFNLFIGDPVEDNDRYFYFVFYLGKSWKIKEE